jgi:hypothetical protein
LAVLGTVAISAARSYLSAHHAGSGALATATVHGYTSAFTVAAVVMGIGLLISLLFIRTPKTEPAGPATEEALAVG